VVAQGTPRPSSSGEGTSGGDRHPLPKPLIPKRLVGWFFGGCCSGWSQADGYANDSVGAMTSDWCCFLLVSRLSGITGFVQSQHKLDNAVVGVIRIIRACERQASSSDLGLAWEAFFAEKTNVRRKTRQRKEPAGGEPGGPGLITNRQGQRNRGGGCGKAWLPQHRDGYLSVTILPSAWDPGPSVWWAELR
jgi:hypothetical protein